VHGLLVWFGRGDGLPAYRRRWVAIATPFAVLALVLVLSGCQGFLFKNRYGSDDPTSGRLDTWKQVAAEWRDAGVVEKVFGDTKTARAVVTREETRQPTDSAAVGALRRGGLLGVLAFLLGLALLVRHALRGVLWTGPRPPPAWFPVAALGAVPTAVTADHLLGGTGGTLWILLLAGEAWLVLRNDPPGVRADDALSPTHESHPAEI
jgi:hypothetical protein